LVVEADHTTAESYRVGLTIAGFEVDSSVDGEEALGQIIWRGIPDVIVLDLGLPRVDATTRRRDSFDLLDALHASRLTDAIRVLAISNDGTSLLEAVNRGASECLPSQLAASSLVRVVKDMIAEEHPRGQIGVHDQ
jgi:DNA-binding NarL/FixJ family response regulator